MQSLLIMYLPEFRQGYIAGRRSFFRSGEILTDKDLLDALETERLSGDSTTFHDTSAQFTVGFLCGQMSGPIISRRYEEEEEEHEVRRTRLLRELRQELGEQAPDTLLTAIRQMWETEEQLAALVDTTWFERILYQDLSPLFKRVVES